MNSRLIDRYTVQLEKIKLKIKFLLFVFKNMIKLTIKAINYLI